MRDFYSEFEEMHVLVVKTTACVTGIPLAVHKVCGITIISCHSFRLFIPLALCVLPI